MNEGAYSFGAFNAIESGVCVDSAQVCLWGGEVDELAI